MKTTHRIISGAATALALAAGLGLTAPVGASARVFDSCHTDRPTPQANSPAWKCTFARNGRIQPVTHSRKHANAHRFRLFGPLRTN